MNKYIIYGIGILLLAAIVILFVTGSGNRTKSRFFDERITLKRQDKIPYGTYASFEGLRYIFPKAKIYTSRREPGFWDFISSYKPHQALIIVCASFKPGDYEMKRLVNFVKNGNDVFISTRYISYTASNIFGCGVNTYDLDPIPARILYDSMRIGLEDPPFATASLYSYPGKACGSFFSRLDTSTTTMLGYDRNDSPDFIRLKAGDGNFYLHLEPLAFSNYFVLHTENKDYYEKVLSVIDPEVTNVVWDEYFLNKRDQFNEPENENKGWFTVLMNLKNSNGQRSFRPAFGLLILLLALYVLLGMRRRQKHIPVVIRPGNDSLDFVKTIGRLYYDRGDHKNLCRKMAAYFLEHVRNKYKLPTGTLDDHFIDQLRYKSGAEESEIRGIVSFIKYLDDEPVISNSALTGFHRELESFYKKA